MLFFSVALTFRKEKKHFIVTSTAFICFKATFLLSPQWHLLTDSPMHQAIEIQIYVSAEMVTSWLVSWPGLPLILVNVKFLPFQVLLGSGLAQLREIGRCSAGDLRLLEPWTKVLHAGSYSVSSSAGGCSPTTIFLPSHPWQSEAGQAPNGC